MATEVTLPQLGESVTEGTITAWLVDVGQEVQADQPLFELSSDKIDTEVPAPTGGVLQEIKVSVDETVDVGTVVAVIGEGGGEEASEQQAATDEQQGEAPSDAQESAPQETTSQEPAAEEPQAEQQEEEQPAAQPAASGNGEAVTEGGEAQPAAAGH